MERHPHLKEKLKLAYELQLNPRVASNQDLAKAIGKSRQAISRWCVGTETSRANAIPIDVIPKVAEALHINPEWLALSLEEFTSKVNERFGDQTSDSELNDLKISISTLPITSVEIFGREAELQLLDQYWFDKKTNVVEIVAFGGSGKSSLVNTWLSKLSSSNYKGANRIYAWSFYWQSQLNDVKFSGDYFIEHALDWFGDEDPASGSAWSKANRLAAHIRRTRTLIVLDGLEPLQYPAGKSYGQIENPAISLLIKELATDNNGLCVLTTRYTIQDLSAFRDERVKSINLSGISSEFGALMLEKSGVKGSYRELADAVGIYAGHAMSLQLLAGYVNTVHKGNLASSTHSTRLLSDEGSRSKVEKLLKTSLFHFKDDAEMQIVKLVSLLGRSTSFSEIREIAQIKNIAGLTDLLQELTETKWLFAIRDLELSRLVSVNEDRAEVFLDCHPLVKEYVCQQIQSLEENLWLEGHKVIFSYLSDSFCESPTSMAQYEPFFRAVLHATMADLYEEAFYIYFEKIRKRQFSMFAEGSHHADSSCLSVFFERDWDRPVQCLPEDAQIFLLMSAATNSIYLGNIERAIDPSRKCIEWFKSNNSPLQAALAAGPLTSMYIASGELAAAKDLIIEMESVVHESKNEVVLAMHSTISAYIQFLSGNFSLAKSTFEEFDSILTAPVPSCPVEFPTISAYYCKFLLDTGQEEKALERSLKTFAWREMKSWQVASDTTSLLASDILVLGLIFLKLGDMSNAYKYLDKQVELFKSSDEWLYLPTGLNSRARFYSATDDFESALDDLRESIEIATNTGAKFGEWEAHLDMAQVYLAMNDKSLSSKSLEKAKQMPNMDQYKFRDHEIAELESKLAMH